MPHRIKLLNIKQVRSFIQFFSKAGFSEISSGMNEKKSLYQSNSWRCKKTCVELMFVPP